MIALSSSKTKRMVALHGWSGLVIAALLYVVVLSGAVVVFADELGRWSAGETVAPPPIEGQIDRTVRQLSRKVDPEFLSQISVSQTEVGLQVLFQASVDQGDGKTRNDGVLFIVDRQSREIVSERAGPLTELFPRDPGDALLNFLITLHVRLHIPGMLGLFATGVLGLWMMISSLTGLLAHRHLLRDLFVAERPGGKISSVRDRHVLAGSWGLPFSFLLALTGAFFSFAGGLAIPIVGLVAFGGDDEALVEAALGIPRPINTAPAPLANLDYMLVDAATIAGALPASVEINNFGRMDALVITAHPPGRGGLTETTLLFDGPSRRFEGEKPLIGMEASTSSLLISLMEPLHFGHFAGTVSKLLWGVMGAAMCFVILSGTRLWLRRRAKEPRWLPVRRAMVATTYGFPIAMVASAYGHFAALPVGGSAAWVSSTFLSAAILVLMYGLCSRPVEQTARTLRLVLGTGLMALPIFRLLAGGIAWSEALIAGATAVPIIDLLLLAGGSLLAWWPRVVHANRPAGLPAQ